MIPTQHNEEGKYYTQLELERRKRQVLASALDTLRMRDIDEIQTHFLSLDRIAIAQIVDMGFDDATVEALLLLPLVHVAHSDGVTSAEHKRIMLLAEESGLKSGTAGFDFLEEALRKGPVPEDLPRCLDLIRRLFEGMKDSERAKLDLAWLAVSVGEASGGVLGFGKKISDEQRKVLLEIFEGLGLEKSYQWPSLLNALDG